MNLQPPESMGDDPLYIGFDNESFAQIYNYDSGLSQLIIYTYDSELNYSDRTIITVGGYVCQYDIALNWAIYKYNTSQSEYRVVIDDYHDNFGWNNYDEAVAAKTALIAYFNDGNAPDIFYGNQFDYDALFDGGSLLDISEYMSNNFSSRFNEITSNIRDAMLSDDGKCYRLFAGYLIDGFLSAYDVDIDLSVKDAMNYAQELDITLYPCEIGTMSTDLARNAIEFSISDDGLYGEEELQQILEYAYRYGFVDLDSSTPVNLASSNVNDYLLWNQRIFSVIRLDDIIKSSGEDLAYVGYPALSGSSHVIIPIGQVAISSSASYPEECTQVLSYLLDAQTQDMENLSCIIPVNDICMRKMVQYAQDHSSIPDDDIEYRSYLNHTVEVSDEAARAFYSYVDSLDTVLYYDTQMESIIEYEVLSYYTENKPVDMIAQALYSRLELYLSE